MKVNTSLATFLIIGCASPAPDPPLGPSPCPAVTGGIPFEADHPETLAGDYDIKLIATARDVEGSTSTGQLVLRSTKRLPKTADPYAVGIGRAIVIGWTDIPLHPIAACTNGDPNSRDPDDPGIIHAFDGNLQLGSGAWADGCSTVLIVQERGVSGFRGLWESGYALAVRVDSRGKLLRDRGWFCAVERDSA